MSQDDDMSRYAFDPDAAPTSMVDRGRSRDGIELLRRRWEADTPRAAVLLVHGIGEHSGRYEHVGRQLADAGFVTVGYDQRGFGASGGRKAYVDRFTQYLDDAEDLLRELRAQRIPTVLLGHSMGGLIALAYVLRDRPPPDLLVLSAPALGTDTPAWMRSAAEGLGRWAPRVKMKATFGGPELSRDERVGEAYENDPLVQRSTSARLGREIFRTIAWCRRTIGELDVPTLVVHGSEDVLVPTASTEILEGLPGVDRHVVEGARHEVFNEPEGPEAVADVISWVDARL